MHWLGEHDAGSVAHYFHLAAIDRRRKRVGSVLPIKSKPKKSVETDASRLRRRDDVAKDKNLRAHARKRIFS